MISFVTMSEVMIGTKQSYNLLITLSLYTTTNILYVKSPGHISEG